MTGVACGQKEAFKITCLGPKKGTKAKKNLNGILKKWPVQIKIYHIVSNDTMCCAVYITNEVRVSCLTELKNHSPLSAQFNV